MTILELLDRLEASLSSLLPTAANGHPTGTKKTGRTSKRTRGPRQRAKVPAGDAPVKSEAVTEQPAAVQPEADSEKEKSAEAARLLGKRQALGRSLLQLRKLSVHRKDEK